MSDATTAIPEYILIECPGCAAVGRVSGADGFQPLTHEDACPQASLPLTERTYTVTIPKAA